MNFRVCDVMATNGCLISSYSPFLQTQFPDLNIPMFKDSFEARHIISQFLKDDTARKQFVEECKKAVNKNWCFENRFKEMEEILGINLLQNTKIGSLKILLPKFNDTK